MQMQAVADQPAYVIGGVGILVLFITYVMFRALGLGVKAAFTNALVILVLYGAMIVWLAFLP